MISNRTIFKSIKEVEYIFKESKTESQQLLLVFSDFHGREKERIKSTYSYLNDISIDTINVLYILDEIDGEVSYYLGNDRTHNFESSIIALINSIAGYKNINSENIYSFGTGKGGFAALYFGLKYNFGNIITSMPHILLGNYLYSLSSYTKKVAEFIAGDFTLDENKTYLNSLICNLLASPFSKSKISLLVDCSHRNYKTQIVPFISKLNDCNVHYTIDYSDNAFGKENVMSFLISNLKKDKVDRIVNQLSISCTILGSCITRDIFNEGDSSLIKLDSYFSRTGFLSLMSEPIELKEQELDLESNFQRKMIMYDFKREFVNNIKSNDPSDYLIIDFIDERFDAININGEYVTCSWEFMSTPIYQELKHLRVSKVNLIEKWKESCLEFIQLILKYYSPSQIILHKGWNKNQYLDIKGEIKTFDEKIIEHNQKINSILHKFYNFFEENIEGINIIDINFKKQYLAFEGHRWGLAAVHYNDQYYKDTILEIEKIMKINIKNSEIKVW